VVRAVTGRPMAMAPSIVARQQPVQRIDGIGIRPGAELDDDDPGGRVGHEDGQQAVTARRLLRDEPPAGVGQVGEPPLRPGLNRKLDGLQWSAAYGKMLRSASRSRPSPPLAGADS